MQYFNFIMSVDLFERIKYLEIVVDAMIDSPESMEMFDLMMLYAVLHNKAVRSSITAVKYGELHV